MVSTRRSVSGDRPAVGLAQYRFVRDLSKPQAAGVRVSNARPDGICSGQPVHVLAHGVGVCISSHSSGSENSAKSGISQVSRGAHSSVLAQSTVVPRSHSVTSRQSQVSASASGPVVSEQGSTSSSQPAGASPSRLAVVRGALRDRGFSLAAAQCISQPQRQSTLAIYQSKWKCFTGWCKARKIDFLDPTVPQVADFLMFLHTDRHFAPSTIDGYRTAISNTMKSIDGRDLGHDPQLTALIVSFYQARPASRPIPVDWDLSLVLKMLMGPPFEPIRTAQLKWLTYKTVFLVAFASVRRRGELHALIVDKLAHGVGWSSATIFSDPAFLPKTHVPTRGTGLPPLVIPALSQSEDLRFDEDGPLLCPV